MTTEDLAADAAADAEAPAYFTTDGDTFVPTALAQGPWGASISGMYVGGILAHVIERDAGDPELQPVRLTVDLLRPAALEPVLIRTTVIRDGRRLRLVDADMFQSDRIVARATAMWALHGGQPSDSVWTSPVFMPPLPPEPDDGPARHTLIWAFGSDVDPAGPSSDPGQLAT